MATRAPKKHPAPRDSHPDTDPDRLDKRRTLQVRMMASTKTNVKAIAEMMGITTYQLKRSYAKELRDGHDYVYAAMSQKLVASGMSGDVRSMLAWLRQFGGWQEITRKEVTGKDGAPISFQNLDTSALNSVLEALSTVGSGRSINGSNRPKQIDVDPEPDPEPEQD